MNFTFPYFKSSKKIIMVLAGIGIVLWMIGFKSSNKDVDSDPIIEIAQVKKQTIPNIIKIPSVLNPYTQVLIRSRVDGVIKEILFKEGQVVKKDDILFLIDDDMFQAQLRQAEANLQKDKVQFEQAVKEVKRNKGLAKKNIVTQSQFDQLVTTQKSLEASVAGDQAAIDLLKLQITYAKIKSPIEGVIGFLKVEQGNFVRQAENTPLVSIAQINPLEAIFEVPERYLSQVLKTGISNISIQLIDIHGKILTTKASPVALDNSVNSKSGVIPLKANVDNNDFQLRPGTSITGSITIGSFENVLAIPIDGLMNGQDEQYVYMYNSETQNVSKQAVETLEVTEKKAIIKSGLAENQQVVINGQINLKDGAKVKLKP